MSDKDKKSEDQKKIEGAEIGGRSTGTTTFYRSFSVFAQCPKCKTQGPTNTSQACNILNCVFACFCGGYWSCYTAYKTKDYNCTNTVHKCGSCGEVVGEYNACS